MLSKKLTPAESSNHSNIINMKTYFNFRKKLYGGVWEIKSDMPYSILSDGPFDEANLKLLDLPFRICHGKKQRDIIYRYEDISIEFLSQNIYSFLSRYGDVRPYLYPIHIEGVDDVYYFVHDLPEFEFINRDASLGLNTTEEEVSCFLLQDDMPPFFTMDNTRCKIITPEMKAAMIKEKLTNISFEPVYGVSSMEEYYELQRNDQLRYPTKP